MRERADRLHRKTNRVRDYLMQQMLLLEKRKLETPEFEMVIKKNPPSVVIDNQDLIPTKYWIEQPAPPPKLDKAQIKKDIDMGDEVPGAHLHQGERLEIKE